MDLYIPSLCVFLLRYPLVIDFECVLLLPFYFLQPYLHKILCTKIFYPHIYISNVHVYQKSLNYFYLLNILLIEKHLVLVGYSPACVYDLYMLQLLLFLHLFFHIVVSELNLYLFLISHILFVFYI